MFSRALQTVVKKIFDMIHHTLNQRKQATTAKNSATFSSSTTTNPQARQRLNDFHYRHCCGKDSQQKERGLNPDWIAANCYSVDQKQASELLAYPAQSGGIILEGANGQFQFRPDRPWRTSSDKQKKRKAAKYRTAAGDEYDAFLPRHPDNPDYWLDRQALKQSCWLLNGVPHILLTEGAFKAICACSEGIPTVALLGVEMGLTSSQADPQGKRYLVPALEQLAREGFGFIIGFDADISSKKKRPASFIQARLPTQII